jgi:hypothetical protein
MQPRFMGQGAPASRHVGPRGPPPPRRSALAAALTKPTAVPCRMGEALHAIRCDAARLAYATLAARQPADSRAWLGRGRAGPAPACDTTEEVRGPQPRTQNRACEGPRAVRDAPLACDVLVPTRDTSRLTTAKAARRGNWACCQSGRCGHGHRQAAGETGEATRTVGQDPWRIVPVNVGQAPRDLQAINLRHARWRICSKHLGLCRAGRRARRRHPLVATHFGTCGAAAPCAAPSPNGRSAMRSWGFELHSSLLFTCQGASQGHRSIKTRCSRAG